MFIVPMSPISLTSEVNATNTAVQNEKTALPFADVFKQAIDNVKETQAIADQDAINLALGNADDLHTIMINSAKATAALELSVQLTSKAVSAYNEIIKMQI